MLFIRPIFKFDQSLVSFFSLSENVHERGPNLGEREFVENKINQSQAISESGKASSWSKHFYNRTLQGVWTWVKLLAWPRLIVNMRWGLCFVEVGFYNYCSPDSVLRSQTCVQRSFTVRSACDHACTVQVGKLNVPGTVYGEFLRMFGKNSSNLSFNLYTFCDI